jgi:hypothetical protein
MSATQTVSGFLAGVSERNRAEAKRVHAFIRRVAPTLKPGVMGGMLGYGKFHYRYASGREGDTALLALADRADGLSLYVNCVSGDQYLPEKYARRLGKVSCGKSCIRFKRLEDLNEDGLAALIREATAIGGAGKV